MSTRFLPVLLLELLLESSKQGLEVTLVRESKLLPRGRHRGRRNANEHQGQQDVVSKHYYKRSIGIYCNVRICFLFEKCLMMHD